MCYGHRELPNYVKLQYYTKIFICTKTFLCTQKWFYDYVIYKIAQE